MTPNQNRRDRDAAQLSGFTRAKRDLSARGLGRVIVPPGGVDGNSLTPADRVIAADNALGARMGASAGLTGAGLRRRGLDTNLASPANKREVYLSPFIAGLVSDAIHNRYGEKIGDDFDANYLRGVTVAASRC